jgi:uncharacterized protein with HEPN domain
MPKRDSSLYIVDILIAINKCQRYIADFDNAEDFKWSELHWDATLRELEIIGEATNKLIAYKLLDNQKYRKIVDFRNLIIHAYFGIDEDEVWIVLTQKLELFSEALLSLIKTQSIFLDDALECAKDENHKNKELVSYLSGLSKKL